MSALFQDPTITTAIPNGAPTVTYPLSQFGNYAKVYSQPFVVHSGYDAINTIGGTGLFATTTLAEESERSPLGGGFYGFNRVYAQTPSGHNDFQSLVYSFPAMQTWRPDPRVATTTVRVWNDFFQTDSPQSITLSGAQIWRNVYGFDVGQLSAITIPTATEYSGWVGSGREFIAQDAQLSRFMGNIYRRETFYVKAQ